MAQNSFLFFRDFKNQVRFFRPGTVLFEMNVLFIQGNTPLYLSLCSSHKLRLHCSVA